MSELAEILVSLGLEQYHDALISEGFDNWDTVQDITEQDLEILNVKLGHRRKLQRFIASQRGITLDQPLAPPHYDATDKGLETGSLATLEDENERSGSGSRTKRKYKRHPKPDENGPERPPSAYVLFSNAIRDEVKGQDLTFTEIAKLAGQKWQALTPGEREPYEARAATLKDNFNDELAAYKKTEQYREYSQYLAEFKAKHGGTSEGKRIKVEPGSGTSVGSLGMQNISLSVSSRSSEPENSTPFQTHGRPNFGGPGPVDVHYNFESPPPHGSGQLSYGGAFRERVNPTSPAVDVDPANRLGSRRQPGGHATSPATEASSYFSSTRSAHRDVGAPTPGPGPTTRSAKPPLFHQDTAYSTSSSAPSTLSYGSGSTSASFTPQTPRDDTWLSRYPAVDSFKTPGPAWESHRPVLPPLPSPQGSGASVLKPVILPDRPFPPTDSRGHATGSLTPTQPLPKLPPPLQYSPLGPRGPEVRELPRYGADSDGPRRGEESALQGSEGTGRKAR